MIMINNDNDDNVNSKNKGNTLDSLKINDNTLGFDIGQNHSGTAQHLPEPQQLSLHYSNTICDIAIEIMLLDAYHQQYRYKQFDAT